MTGLVIVIVIVIVIVTVTVVVTVVVIVIGPFVMIAVAAVVARNVNGLRIDGIALLHNTISFRVSVGIGIRARDAYTSARSIGDIGNTKFIGKHSESISQCKTI